MVINGLQQQLDSKEEALRNHQVQLEQRDQPTRSRGTRIEILEELLRHKKIQQFCQQQRTLTVLFDEAELEVEIDDLRDQLPDDVEEENAPTRTGKRRQRGLSDTILRERIELTLSDEEKAGATKAFFTKVKEELEFVPDQLKVLEYWLDKAVFEQDGEECVVAASRAAPAKGKKPTLKVQCGTQSYPQTVRY